MTRRARRYVLGSSRPFRPSRVRRSKADTYSKGRVRRIGPYKLLQEIGEGGMGVVYMAEQEKPVRRRVALKIIKPGMDTSQVIARFEAERRRSPSWTTSTSPRSSMPAPPRPAARIS